MCIRDSCYFDADASGKYQRSFRNESLDAKDLTNRGRNRVRPFIDWCRENQVRGFVGEFGSPPNDEWRKVTERFLDACIEDDVVVCYWATGEWWGNYPLSIQPPANSESTAPQLRWLKQANDARNAIGAEKLWKKN